MKRHIKDFPYDTQISSFPFKSKTFIYYRRVFSYDTLYRTLERWKISVTRTWIYWLGDHLLNKYYMLTTRKRIGLFLTAFNVWCMMPVRSRSWTLGPLAMCQYTDFFVVALPHKCSRWVSAPVSGTRWVCSQQPDKRRQSQRWVHQTKIFLAPSLRKLIFSIRRERKSHLVFPLVLSPVLSAFV